MTDTTISRSGTVQRIHVETSDITTMVRLTLAGESDIYYAATREAELREVLELTAPGDVVSFSYGPTGWIVKGQTLRHFRNDTLAKELRHSNIPPG